MSQHFFFKIWFSCACVALATECRATSQSWLYAKRIDPFGIGTLFIGDGGRDRPRATGCLGYGKSKVV
jgi:hypothetical protein